MDYSSIAKEVLKKIVPTKEEEKQIHEIINELIEKTKNSIKKFNLNAFPILVGSVAKGTYTKNPDIDIFIMFPSETKREELEKFGLKIGKEVIKGEERYAEHPYIHGFYRELEVDIVPCYKIDNINQKMTAVDRTPLHTEFVIKNLKEKQKNEVRLLKQFLRGIGVYGAENSVQGFSGYLTELLIIKYGNFRNLLNNAKNFRRGEVLYLGENKNFKNFNEPLTFIDPIDKNRNVASALSLQNFSLFVFAVKEFLDGANLKFFFPNKIKVKTKKEILKKMKERKTKLVAILFENPNIIDDILFPQLRKTENAIIKICEENHFKVHKAKFFVREKILMVFEFESFLLPNLKKHLGPPIYAENVKEFLDKWKNSKNALSYPYIKRDRWCVDIRRKYCKVEELIKNELLNLSLGSYVRKEIKKKYKILVDKEILRKEFLGFLTEFYFEKFRWEN